MLIRSRILSGMTYIKWFWSLYSLLSYRTVLKDGCSLEVEVSLFNVCFFVFFRHFAWTVKHLLFHIFQYWFWSFRSMELTLLLELLSQFWKYHRGIMFLIYVLLLVIDLFFLWLFIVSWSGILLIPFSWERNGKIDKVTTNSKMQYLFSILKGSFQYKVLHKVFV